MPPEMRSQALLPALALLAALFALMQLRSVPPAPVPSDAPEDRFSAERARSVLEALVGDGVPHPVGSDASTRVRERVLQRLTTLGYRPEVQEAFTCGVNGVCATVHNVVARLDATEPGKAVLLATHYDSVGAGPGASDAGVSVAIVLEIARVLKQRPPPRNPVILLIDDGEEAGLLGAEAFAAKHPAARTVGAVVNLEARGTSGQSVMFETSGENAWLIALLARSLSRPSASSLFYPIYTRLPNDTDLTVFKRFGMPGVNFAFIGDVAKYHTPLDNLENASPRSLQHQGDNALAMVRALADADLATHRRGDAVFFDVLGLVVVRWPAPWTVVLAAASLILVVASIVLRMRAGQLRRSHLIGGFAAWIVMLILSGGAAFGLPQLLVGGGAFRGEAVAWPTVTVVAFWMLALAVVTATAALAVRRAGRTGAWTGCWLGWSLLGLGAAVYVPEASYLAIVPALVAGTVGLVGAGFQTDEPGWLTLALPLVTAALLWMAPAWFLFDALGVPILPVIGGAVAFMLTPLAPFFADASGGWRWGTPAGALAGTTACALMAWSAPSFSPDRPERMNLAFVQEVGAPEARWIVTPQSRERSAALREAAPFGGALTKAYPWSISETAFAATARAVGSRAPELQILANEARGDDRSVRARLVSPRGARVAALVLPADRRVSVAIGGHEIPQRPRDDRRGLLARGLGSGTRSYACVTLPPEGIDIELTIAGEEPLEGYLFDQTPGLPPGGEVLQKARPRDATAIGSGDTTVLVRRVVL